jgi:predicted alpha/beta superfamily hydrolase
MSRAHAPTTPPDAEPGHVDVHWFAGRGPTAGRRVRIWRPALTGAAATAPHAVLYLQDGQNALDDANATTGRGLRLHRAAQRLCQQGKLRPVLLVAIDHSGPGRTFDYTAVPWQGRGGGGLAYAEFLLAKVLPFVAAHYPVAAGPAGHALGGCSLGGLFALTAALHWPTVFGHAAAWSPSAFWAGDHLLRQVLSHRQQPVRLWLEAGSREGAELRRSVAALAERLLLCGWQKHRSARRATLRHTAVRGGRHDEASWGARSGRLLPFLFPPEPKPKPPKQRPARPKSRPPRDVEAT